jgi:hypothetical protein
MVLVNSRSRECWRMTQDGKRREWESGKAAVAAVVRMNGRRHSSVIVELLLTQERTPHTTRGLRMAGLV